MSTTVRTTQKTWAQAVQEADPDRDERQEPGYEFSNGAKFATPKR
jgi:hypothetical protein